MGAMDKFKKKKFARKEVRSDMCIDGVGPRVAGAYTSSAEWRVYYNMLKLTLGEETHGLTAEETLTPCAKRQSRFAIPNPINASGLASRRRKGKESKVRRIPRRSASKVPKAQTKNAVLSEDVALTTIRAALKFKNLRKPRKTAAKASKNKRSVVSEDVTLTTALAAFKLRKPRKIRRAQKTLRIDKCFVEGEDPLVAGPYQPKGSNRFPQLAFGSSAPKIATATEFRRKPRLSAFQQSHARKLLRGGRTHAAPVPTSQRQRTTLD